MKENKDIITQEFKAAQKDYYDLLNKDYPEKETLKLVGDRYRLTGLQRTLLYRGITSGQNATQRKLKITTDMAGRELFIDGYNVLFTIMNYLLGKTLFIANDGLLRDCGEQYGKIEKEEFFNRAVNLLFQFLGTGKPLKINIFLDSPVSNSDTHKQYIGKQINESGIRGEVHRVPQADDILKEQKDKLIATSDSQIIDAVSGPVIDLPRLTLESSFEIMFLNLNC